MAAAGSARSQSMTPSWLPVGSQSQLRGWKSPWLATAGMWGPSQASPARAVARQRPLRRREQAAALVQVPVYPAGHAADVGAGPRRLGAFVQAAKQQASLPVHLPFLACAELEFQDRLAGHSRNDHDQEFRVRGGQLRGAVRPERLRPVLQGGHFPCVKAVRGMALEVPAPAGGAGKPPYCRAVPRPGTVGHTRDLPCHLARERSERSWQSRHGSESSQDPDGYWARTAEVAAADAGQLTHDAAITGNAAYRFGDVTPEHEVTSDDELPGLLTFQHYTSREAREARGNS